MKFTILEKGNVLTEYVSFISSEEYIAIAILRLVEMEKAVVEGKLLILSIRIDMNLNLLFVENRCGCNWPCRRSTRSFARIKRQKVIESIFDCYLSNVYSIELSFLFVVVTLIQQYLAES